MFRALRIATGDDLEASTRQNTIVGLFTLTIHQVRETRSFHETGKRLYPLWKTIEHGTDKHVAGNTA